MRHQRERVSTASADNSETGAWRFCRRHCEDGLRVEKRPHLLSLLQGEPGKTGGTLKIEEQPIQASLVRPGGPSLFPENCRSSPRWISTGSWACRTAAIPWRWRWLPGRAARGGSRGLSAWSGTCTYPPWGRPAPSVAWGWWWRQGRPPLLRETPPPLRQALYCIHPVPALRHVVHSMKPTSHSTEVFVRGLHANRLLQGLL